MDHAEQPFRVLSHLAMLVLRAMQEGRIKLDERSLEWIDKGRGANEFLFDLASEAELGESAETENAEALLRLLPADTELVLFDIAGGWTTTVTAEEALDKKEAGMVGVVFFALRDPEWMFWRPIGVPYFDARLLMLPKWITASLTK